MILNLIGLFLKLSSSLAKYAENKQLMDSGAAKAIAKNNDAAYKKLKAAIDARRTAKLDSDSLRDDPANRD
jgi:hypothetical protein